MDLDDQIALWIKIRFGPPARHDDLAVGLRQDRPQVVLCAEARRK